MGSPRRYRVGVTNHLRTGHVVAAERGAREVAERPEDHRRAEEEGKKRSAGDLPEDLER